MTLGYCIQGTSFRNLIVMSEFSEIADRKPISTCWCVWIKL